MTTLGEAAVLPPPMLWLVLLSTLLPSGWARLAGTTQRVVNCVL